MKVVYRIREVAAVRGLSFRELSRRCGMTNTGISQIASGKHGTTVDVLVRMAWALEVPFSVLIDVTDDDGNAVGYRIAGLPSLPTYSEWVASADGSRRMVEANGVDGMVRTEHRGRPRKEAEDDTPTKWQKKPRIRLAEPVHQPDCRGRNRVYANSEEVEAIEEAAKALLRDGPMASARN